MHDFMILGSSSSIGNSNNSGSSTGGTTGSTTDAEETCNPSDSSSSKMINITTWSLKCMYYCDAGSSQAEHGECNVEKWSSGGTSVRSKM